MICMAVYRQWLETTREMLPQVAKPCCAVVLTPSWWRPSWRRQRVTGGCHSGGPPAALVSFIVVDSASWPNFENLLWFFGNSQAG